MTLEDRAQNTVPESNIDFFDFYRKNGIQWGAGDIFVVGSGGLLGRLAELITILAAFHDESGTPAIQSIILVHPLGTDSETDFEERLWDGIRYTVASWRGTPLEKSEEEAIHRRIHVTAPHDMQVSSVLSVIDAAPEHAAIIVSQGALYRTSDTKGLAPMAGDNAVAIPEDFWVPHFNFLCERAIAAAGQSETYVVLDAGEEWPTRELHRKLLLSIDGCGVMAGEVKDNPDTILATKVDGWNAKISAGQVAAVLSEISGLPLALDYMKPLLRLQAFEKAGFYPMVLSELQSMPELTQNLPPATALQVAQIAHVSGASEISQTLLENVTLEGLPPEHLDNALILAQQIGLHDVLKRCKKLLSELYPRSLALRQVRINELFSERQYLELAQLLAEGTSDDEQDAAEMYLMIAEGLQDAPLDYEELLNSVVLRVPSQKERTKRILSREALLVNQPALALQIVLPDSENSEVAKSTVSSILLALEHVVLTRDERGGIGIQPNTASIAITFVLRYLAHHPTDGLVRMRLVDVMSAQSMGGLGLATLATITLRLAQDRTASLATSEYRDRSAKASPEELLAFMRVALPWLSDNAPIFLGKTTLPANLLTVPPDRLIEGALLMLTHYEPIDSAADAETFGQLVAATLSIVPHGTDKDADLAILRVAAVRLALARRFQKARDYAEHALQLAAGDPRRGRLAWLCFGDVYERTGEIIQGLVAVACGLSADPSASPEQVWHESLLHYRLMRDLHMLPFALSFLEAGRELLRNLGTLDEYEQRIDTLMLQARLLAIQLENGAGDRSFLEDLLDPIMINAKAVLAKHDEPEPAAALLSEFIRQLSMQGGHIPSEAREILGRLVDRSSRSQTAILSALGAEFPSAEQVLAVLEQLEEATQAADTAYDVRSLVILAERLLAGTEATGDPQIAAFTIELMADHAISLRLTEGEPAWQSLNQIGQSGGVASEFSHHADIPVVMIGIDSQGRLLRTSAIEGILHTPVREALDVFSKKRLLEWSEEFPFRYGVDSQTLNLFYTSTEGIGVSELPERAVLVMSTELQPFPVNLMRLGDELAGFSRRLAIVPSLQWLMSSCKVTPSTNAHQVAWIPTAAQPEFRATLTTVADRLRASLAEYGIELNENAEIPADLRDAELAIVVAHGSLVPEGRFFQVVRDDANLAASSAELANALEGVGVAILFVCSGGRMDKHPMANTTLGLTRQLLGNGCAAVVASPWPLDSRVPSYWVPKFLEQWNDNSALVDAVFDANLYVRKMFSGEPRDCLAMHLYGDALRRKV